MTTNTDLHGAMPELPVVAWMTDDGRVSSDETKQCMPRASKVNFNKPLVRLSDARAAIQQAAVPERADLLQSCRGSVKADLMRYEQMILSCNRGSKPVLEAEANRLRALLDSIDTLSASPAPPKQQPALGRGEVGGVPLTTLAKLGKRYSLDFASPHHMTFSVEGLRQLIQAVTAGQINPDSAGQGMEAGV